MKRFLYLCYLLSAVIAITAVCGLSGCSTFDSVIYTDSDKYSVGDAAISDTVENIEIDWRSGSVNIVSHSEHSVLISEDIDSEASDDLRVHWWLDGTTLHVKFAASGVRLRLLDTEQKNLTLTVPDTLTASSVNVRAASADIDAAELKAERLNVSTASGSMNIQCEAEDIMLNSASGGVQLNQKGNAKQVNISTASGDIDADLECADTAEIEAVSGSINISGDTTGALFAKTTSGEFSGSFKTTPSKCELCSTSGKITLILPENSDFSAIVSTTSGDFDSDFALKKDGNKYICGNGSNDIDIETTSGDITIREEQY